MRRNSRPLRPSPSGPAPAHPNWYDDRFQAVQNHRTLAFFFENFTDFDRILDKGF
jgi:hypothetical protein